MIVASQFATSSVTACARNRPGREELLSFPFDGMRRSAHTLPDARTRHQARPL